MNTLTLKGKRSLSKWNQGKLYLGREGCVLQELAAPWDPSQRNHKLASLFLSNPNTSVHMTACIIPSGENVHTLSYQDDNWLLHLKYAINTYRLLKYWVDKEDPVNHRKSVQPHFHGSSLCDFCSGWKLKHVTRLTPPFWHMNIITPTRWASSLI